MVNIGALHQASFNPLDRGNLNQILGRSAEQGGLDAWFQSPRSGKFESNAPALNKAIADIHWMFQSPRSGKFESNTLFLPRKRLHENVFQSPRSGKFESNGMEFNTPYRADEGFNPLDRGNLNQIRTLGER